MIIDEQTKLNILNIIKAWRAREPLTGTSRLNKSLYAYYEDGTFSIARIADDETVYEAPFDEVTSEDILAAIQASDEA